MKRIARRVPLLTSCLVPCLAGLALAGAPALAQDGPVPRVEGLKIGFVSIERIMRESSAAKSAESRLNQEFSKRDRELQDLAARVKAQAEKIDKDGPILAEAERGRQQRELQEADREYQRRRREFQEDLNQRKNEELQSLIDRAQRIVRALAEQEGYDVVLQDAVFVSPRVDVTEKVLQTLDAAAK